MARAPRTPCWVMLLLLLWAVASTVGAAATSPIVVQLVAAYDQKICDSCCDIFNDAVSDTNKKPGLQGYYYFQAKPVALHTNFTQNVQDLRDAVNLTNADVTVVISVADVRTTLAAVTVGGYHRVPVLGFAPGYFDHTYKEVNPFFQALNPTLKHMAEALSTFLQRNSWLSTTFLIDDSLTSQTLYKKFGDCTRSAQTTLVPRTIPRSANSAQIDAKIFHVLSEVVKLRSRVLLVHCDGALVKRIFQHAKKLNMNTGEWIWILIGDTTGQEEQHFLDYPVGILGMQIRPSKPSKYVAKMSVRLVARALRQLHSNWEQNITIAADEKHAKLIKVEGPDISTNKGIKTWFGEIRKLTEEAVSGLPTGAKEGKPEASLRATVDLLNLVENENGQKEWRPIGNVTGGRVSIEAVVWPGNTLAGPNPSALAFWRVVTANSPPFVMTSEALANHTCLVGVPCLRIATNKKDKLATICADYRAGRREGVTYNVTCCHGYSIDLLVNIAKELHFDFILYLAADGRFGTNKTNICPPEGNMDIDWRNCSLRNCTSNWDGMMADLVTGAAHMAFAPISVTAWRSHCVDFSVPYYYSSVSFLTNTKYREVPLLAFLAPFSAELWIAIFFSLQATAIAAAAYEWLSPFGLNPWGRQRTKNFSLASALWVTWSLLFSHLVAFKAPKSWPNKVLINLWGCFSVIFLASYTANIAALFAGLFFQTPVNNFHDQTLLNKRLGAASGTSSEAYISFTNKMLWNHMQHYNVVDIEEGVRDLRNEELDLLVGDTPLLDYYRGKEPGCTLRTVGEVLHKDTYAIAMSKGLPLKDSISTLIAKYDDNGYLDYLTKRWNQGLPCMRTASEMYRPSMRLSIRAVAGVFIMLCLGMILGCIILFFEHFVYKHVLPDLRKKPKGTIWKSPNLMFFSQKLYRFINCVELVSPHHSAKELVNNLRTGQITSLFQKSIKRKEHEQRRRRKSKAQFFEMIQEIRRVQKEGKGSFTSKGGDSSGTLTTTPETPSGRPLCILEEDIPEQTVFSIGSPNESLEQSHSVPYYMDESCVRLIERVGLKRTPSDMGSDSSDDDAPPCYSPISASMSELCTIVDDTKGRSKQSKVHSYDDLKSWTRPTYDGQDRRHFPYYHHHHHQPHQPYPPTSSFTHGKNNFLRQMPLTKFDFFDLPLRLNDSRLKKVSKEDIVFLWQSSERELRRRLQQALADKYDLERRLATKEAQDRPP